MDSIESKDSLSKFPFNDLIPIVPLLTLNSSEKVFEEKKMQECNLIKTSKPDSIVTSPISSEPSQEQEYFPKPNLSKDPWIEYGLQCEKEGKYVQAIKIYEAQAMKGNDRAHVLLGLIYEHGKIAPKNIAKAIYHYDYAAKIHNNALAHMQLGPLYYTLRDWEKATNHCVSALLFGDLTVCKYLTQMLLDGRQYTYHSLLKLTENGNQSALIMIGIYNFSVHRQDRAAFYFYHAAKISLDPTAEQYLVTLVDLENNTAYRLLKNLSNIHHLNKLSLISLATYEYKFKNNKYISIV